jgi:hypothetical protein
MIRSRRFVGLSDPRALNFSRPGMASLAFRLASARKFFTSFDRSRKIFLTGAKNAMSPNNFARRSGIKRKFYLTAL